MIVGHRKPLAEIRDMLGQAEKILVAGCGTCVAVCMAGGEKEVGVLASQLRLAYGGEGRSLTLDADTVERQCDREFLVPLSRRIREQEYDAVISLACGAGVSLLAEMHPRQHVIPGINTDFIGVAEEAGVWTERCRACGQCQLGYTAGICPVTRCSKSLLNGPCGGPKDDRCETDSRRPCAWVQIFDRLKAQGRLELLQKIRPPLDHTYTHRPQRLIHDAYRKRYKVDDEGV